MNIVVTGGGGFIGRPLVHQLRRRGYCVRVADRVPAPSSDTSYWCGDLSREGAAAAAIPQGTQVVIHLAAETSVLGSVERPYGVYSNNVAVTASLLERCRAIGVAQFIFCSTNAVVGDVGATIIDERTPLKPLTPYGATKAAAEMLVAGFAAPYGITGTILRLTNVYGPGMGRKDTFVARLVRAALACTPINIYGDGRQTRDYVHVDDAVNALTLAIENPWEGPLIIGSGSSISVNALHQLATRIFGLPIAVRHIAARPGEMPTVRVDISRARSQGYSPAVSLVSGLAAVWEDFRHQQACQGQKMLP